ncbi:Hypothetical predicted protein [Cloeon dipterum]|uniref:Uncharacterized protein n=1 Tax=Cloeon dipterum TaxID=197152 RepID=A0A8S1D7W5_9INSE|nr:Hypothetical predicted protein [Cloeon dipterum]
MKFFCLICPSIGLLLFALISALGFCVVASAFEANGAKSSLVRTHSLNAGASPKWAKFSEYSNFYSSALNSE